MYLRPYFLLWKSNVRVKCTFCKFLLYTFQSFYGVFICVDFYTTKKTFSEKNCNVFTKFFLGFLFQTQMRQRLFVIHPVFWRKSFYFQAYISWLAFLTEFLFYLRKKKKENCLQILMAFHFFFRLTLNFTSYISFRIL